MDDDVSAQPTPGSDAAEPVEQDPWLTARQQSVWRGFLLMSRTIEEQIERDMQRSSDMPFAYYLILAMLSEATDHRLRMNKLSEAVGFSQSRLSHAVSRLEDLGWIHREQASKDKRGQYAALTEEGLVTLQRVAPTHAETVRSLVFDPLSAVQLDALQDIIRTVLAAAPPEVIRRHASNIDPSADCPDS